MNKTYIIKRNVDFTDQKIMIKRVDKKKGFTESMLNKNPLSSKFLPGDMIYVYENKNGIWAYGEIVEVSKVLKFNSISQILDFFKKKKVDINWIYSLLIEKLHNSKKDSFITFHEYFINQKLLDRVIPLSNCLESLQGQTSIRELNQEQIDYLKNPEFKNETELSSEIPSRLKMDIYSFFNTKCKLSHVIDIDHFIPKSIGGPGNIIENLVPVGYSLNRYKSNSIPDGLFKVASEYSSLKKFCKKKYESQSGFIRNDNIARDNAMKITSYINGLSDINKAKEFYRKVMDLHHTEYVKLIDEYNCSND